MNLIYNIIIRFSLFLVKLVSPFNTKIRQWTRGTKNWEELMKGKIKSGEKYFWIHCASLGEFEQGRPVIEMFRNVKPDLRIILTFFSPSGYEIRKNYNQADYVCYLPADTPENAARFISIVKPVLAIFVKYEFWNNYISILSGKGIPLYLISGIFRPGQHFFRFYGGFFKKMLSGFSHIFVQDENSAALLRGIGIEKVSVTGDTRFDRVVQIAGAAREIPQLARFRGSEKLLLAGSSWSQDEEIIARYINTYPGQMKYVFAPHEVDKPNIDRLEKLFRVKVIRYSEFNEEVTDARVMIMDNIGLLSSAYRYAYIAAIGGGFGKGIHNVLEPACWGIPVIFGPNYNRFREANDLIKLGGARSFSDFEEFSGIISEWLTSSEAYLTSANNAAGYVKKNTGATNAILEKIIEKDMNSGR